MSVCRLNQWYCIPLHLQIFVESGHVSDMFLVSGAESKTSQPSPTYLGLLMIYSHMP